MWNQLIVKWISRVVIENKTDSGSEIANIENNSAVSMDSNDTEARGLVVFGSNDPKDLKGAFVNILNASSNE